MTVDFFQMRQRRRRQAIYLGQQDLSAIAMRSFSFLLILFTLHTLAMVWLEGMTVGDALWLTLTTATTVGYGDVSAVTLGGRLATVLLIYIGGIYLLANLAGEYFDVRRGRKERMLHGNWEWCMEGHILIINTPAQGGEAYLLRLSRQIRQHGAFAELPILLLTSAYPKGLPQSLRDLGIVHYNGSSDRLGSLPAADAVAARAIIVLAKDEYEARSDALTFDILHRIRDEGDGPKMIIAECVSDENRARFRQAGASQVIRPSRAYPEILVRALVAPGSETILENLFVYEGDHTRRYELTLTGGRNWGEIVSILVKQGCGTPLAFMTEDDQTVCNPDPGLEVRAKAIIILVRVEAIPERETIAALVG